MYHNGTHYQLMKLAEMYFWQLGYEAGAQSKGQYFPIDVMI